MYHYICQQGVLPVLIPDLGSETQEAILKELDGIVFQGGNDVAPQSYGEQPLADGKWAGDAYRDQYELRIMKYALDNDLPVLAICRGMQLLNVYCGGTLYQDIATQQEGALMHRDAVAYDKIHHSIDFKGDNTLSRMYSDFPNPVVNSVHHQAVKEVGDRLSVLAVSSEDGIVEAVEYTGASPGKVLGVQWHPEFSDTLKDAVLPADRLIRYFLHQAEGR